MAIPNRKKDMAGRAFVAMRRAKDLTQQEVAELSRRRFGEEGRLLFPQISRIERGQFDRVTLDDAVHLGAIYGLTPNEVATLFGLWSEPKSKDPDEVIEVRNLARTLPEEDRTQLLRDLQLVILRQRQLQIERRRDESDDDMEKTG